VNDRVAHEDKIDLTGNKITISLRQWNTLLSDFEDYNKELNTHTLPWNDLISLIEQSAQFSPEINIKLTPRLLERIYLQSRFFCEGPWETLEFQMFLHTDVYEGRWNTPINEEDHRKDAGSSGNKNKDAKLDQKTRDGDLKECDD